MKSVVCPVCKGLCIKYGTAKSGSQRWYCKNCKISFTQSIDDASRRINIFLNWLFSKKTQSEMPGEGRTFRRKTSEFWSIWPMPPKIEEPRDVVYVDGIYIARKACILICCDDTNVLGWYLCRDEHSGAWKALMQRIAEPVVVVSDGGTGFNKALKKTWPNSMHQRCVFHAFCQVVFIHAVQGMPVHLHGEADNFTYVVQQYHAALISRVPQVPPGSRRRFYVLFIISDARDAPGIDNGMGSGGIIGRRL